MDRELVFSLLVFGSLWCCFFWSHGFSHGKETTGFQGLRLRLVSALEAMSLLDCD